MVTHVSPTPSVSSGASTAYRRRPSSSTLPRNASSRPDARASSSRDTLVPSSSRPPTTFPPSPPLSYASPPSSYAPPNDRDDSRSARHSRAPSTSSRASTSAARESRERHRSSRHSNRSARTETAAAQPSDSHNSYPWFSQSGDVELTLRDRSGRRRTERYLLHSLILAQNSTIFAHELRAARTIGSGIADIPSSVSARPRVGSLPSSRRNSRDAVPDDQRRFHYELDWSNPTATTKGGVPFLVQSGVDGSQPPPRPRNKPPTSSTSFFRSLSASLSGSSHTRSSSGGTASVDDDVLTAYDNLFLVFYNHAPRLDSRDLSTAYVQCKLLLALASHYSALDVVAPRIDHHLLRFHRHLWPQVAKYPTSYLKLAHLARSKTIFGEALVHVVGQWPSASHNFARGNVDDALIDLIEDKVDDLEELKARVDLKLFRLSLTTSRGDRVSPSTSLLDWMCVSLFRHWLVENTTPATSGILKDTGPAVSSRSHAAAGVTSGGRAYRQLGAGGQVYLGRDEVKNFLKLQSGPAYNRDNVKRMERRMDELKHQAKDVVRPLTRSLLELDADPRNEAAELPYLTCTRVEERDFEYVWGGT